MSARTTVRGADEVSRTMRAAAKDLRNLAAANQAAGDLVARSAQRGAPRRSGRLAGSIRVTAGPDRASITTGVVYAGVQEGGWARRGITGRHYMRNALQANEDAIVAKYQTAAESAVDQIRGA